MVNTYTNQISTLLYGIFTNIYYFKYNGKESFFYKFLYLPNPPIKLPRPPPAPCCNCRITFCNPGIPPIKLQRKLIFSY